MIILLRILPLLVALLQVGVFLSQLNNPQNYPWIVLTGVLALPIASFFIIWKRVGFKHMVEKMTPSFILLVALAFALLLVESRVAQTAVVAIAAVSSFVSLELLFLLAFNPSKYPVNALSRLNIAYVPIAVWYIAYTLNGLQTFLHMGRVWPAVGMTLLGAILFRTTGHPEATRQQNILWTGVGALVGAHVGLLGIIMPISMPMQGIIAALLLSGALRVRRYVHNPKPSRKQSWIEGIVALAAFASLLGTAKWL